jgi:hypothetical protein
MCTQCGCADKPVTIDAYVRTSANDSGGVKNGASIGGSINNSVPKGKAAQIAGFNVPAPYGKGEK